MDKAKIYKMLERDEGLRLKPYKCTAGFLTIGVGRNLDAIGITREMAFQMLDEDVVTAQKACQKIFDSQFDEWGENRQLGWLNLAFNLGYHSLSKFKNTIRAARLEDWKEVEAGLRGSLWFRQVGQRASRVIAMICRDEFPYD